MKNLRDQHREPLQNYTPDGDRSSRIHPNISTSLISLQSIHIQPTSFSIQYENPDNEGFPLWSDQCLDLQGSNFQTESICDENQAVFLYLALGGLDNNVHQRFLQHGKIPSCEYVR